MMASSSYIAAMIRKPAEGFGRDKFRQIRTAHPRTCDHTETICPTKSCVESWSVDWELFFERTAPGRGFQKILARLEEQETKERKVKIRPWCLTHNVQLLESDGPLRITDGEFDTSDLSCPVDNEKARDANYNEDDYCNGHWVVVFTTE